MFQAATMFTCSLYYKAIMQLHRIPQLRSGQAGITVSCQIWSTLDWDPPVHGTVCPATEILTDSWGEGKKEDKTGNAEETFWFCTSSNLSQWKPKGQPRAWCYMFTVLHHTLLLANSRYRQSSPCSPIILHLLPSAASWVGQMVSWFCYTAILVKLY